MLKFAVIIPARMKSSRLPEKPLKDIAGKPMVVRVAERAMKAGAELVAVATDDERIAKVCEENGIQAVMTSEKHPTGTDRLSEACKKLGLSPETIVVNVQGDEPLIPVDVIGRVAECLQENPECSIATAAHPIHDIESFMNPNVVKVVCDCNNRALLFSRAPIPWPRDAFREDPNKLPEDFCAMHHIGLYAYRAKFLNLFPMLRQAPIESLESLEQLRAMWFGHQITVMTLPENLPAGVDTEEDLERVRKIWAETEQA